MSTIYNTGRVCKFGLTCEENDNTFRLPLDPDIKRILSTSRNYYELLHYWTGWRDNVGTPMRQKYIRFTELSNEASTINEADVNFLMKMALGKIAFIPFGYLIDQWRWSLFSGEYSTAEMNEKWWDLRCKWQGLKSDSVRTEENFDPGSKYHIPSNTPYIRYFVSYIIQFQFHKSLCETAGHTGSLHTCDIYKNIEAGDKLAEAMKLGASKPWQDAMEILTGQTKMDATAIMEYFQPLIDWLDEQISEHELTQGWDCTIPSTGGASRAHAASAIVVLLATMYSLLLLRLS
ncbi:PREDICTED: angiotensin-converting enzyme-like [Priapulus caudatus]|uniref:Angiotensin-converting enzyme n=1 Tax=Priapulus caudatus TaxID=37621 RepID=A0ABM1F3Q6_PRICU|nr:PREDICTED: angiotensin-converting enzyme-like [Priapulus caudatus]